VKLGHYNNFYFIGIGGIGMSALARWFYHRGHYTAGYDRTETTLTKNMVSEGIHVHYNDAVSNIPEKILTNKADTLVVYTPAVPANNREYSHFKSLGFDLKKRAEVLGAISKDHYTVAVAGTHGKTTTSSMIAHIVKQSGRKMFAFLGGILTNYNSNFVDSHGGRGKMVLVVEADEFDRSFLHLNPDCEVITSVDEDHLDIYRDKHQLRETFREFILKLNREGQLFIEEKVYEELNVNAFFDGKVITYSLINAEAKAKNIRILDHSYLFDYSDSNNQIDNISLGVPGHHNVANAVAAIAVSLQLGIGKDDIKKALNNYQGVRRRFEYILRSDKIVFVDDYAHHPNEIRAFLTSLKKLYPGKKITAIFQPHLYSRTKDFAAGFANSLSFADEVILLEIYPAREEPIPGVTSELIFNRTQVRERHLMSKDELLEFIKGKKFEVICTIGAGDIDQLVVPIEKILKSNYESTG